MDYIIHILILVGVYSMLALSLDLLVGHTGIMSIAHAAFFGLGAYSTALLSTRLGVRSLGTLLIAGAVGAIASLILSLPAMRLREDYFVVGTFGFQIILTSVLTNWMAVTRGPLGITGIPQPTIFGFPLRSGPEFLLLSTSVAILSFIVLSSLESSAFGRVLHGIREDEVLVESLGKNVFRFKAVVSAVSAAIAAIAGAVYALYVSFIDPTSFTVMDSILILSMVIIGGAGTTVGPVLGATALVVLPEALRFLGLPNNAAANIRQIVYGLVLVGVVARRATSMVGGHHVHR